MLVPFSRPSLEGIAQKTGLRTGAAPFRLMWGGHSWRPPLTLILILFPATAKTPTAKPADRSVRPTRATAASTR